MTVPRPRRASGDPSRVPGAASVDVPVAGRSSEPPAAEEVAPPRLARYRLTVAGGAEVGVAVSGRGVPLVVVHGFAAEGILYAQTLSRLVRMGFKVIAIDSPGHGGTDSVGLLASFDAYTTLLRQTLDHLGVKRAVLAGHSMGGRLVADLAATEPDRALAVVLIDAIVGDPWDRLVNVFRVAPWTYAGFGAALLADTVTTLPLLSHPAQAAKLARLVFPTGANHVRRPWRLAGPLVTIVRSRGSAATLDRIRAHGVPLFFLHGDRDVLVPLCTARSAAERAGGEVIVVHGARHSWLLRDPETFPAILRELRGGAVGDAISAAAAEAGVDVDEATVDEIESVFYRRGAGVLALTPDPRPVPVRAHHRAPRYRWSMPAH